MLLEQISVSGTINHEEEANVNKVLLATYEAMNNDFNSAQAIAELNEAASLINTWNSLQNKKANIQEFTLLRLKQLMHHFLIDIFGLTEEADNNNEKLNGVMDLVIDIRKDARSKKDFSTSDKIRDALQGVGILLKDNKEGTSWQSE